MDIGRNEKRRTEIENLLGMPKTSANVLLRKKMLFSMAQKCGMDTCYRCNEVIKTYEDLTLDHHMNWLNSEDPKKTFFDTTSISFSHVFCNTIHQEKLKSGKHLRGVIIRNEVSTNKTYFEARLRYNKRSISIGYYDTEEEAGEAYDIVATHFWGSRAITNLSLCGLKHTGEVIISWDSILSLRPAHNVVDAPLLYGCKVCGKQITGKGLHCRPCANILQRKKERPDMNVLIEHIKRYGYEHAGRQYGVSGNSIRKWLRQAGVEPKEIKKK